MRASAFKGQESLLEEIIVDNFAGGGGASTGIELATGKPVAIAVNHDPDAIAMHKANHPYTTHYQASVWDIDPVDACEGRPVGLAWFSPDCKHFSKAKGGKPKNKMIRGLAWIALRWAGTVRPRVIILENVEEFQTWGSLNRAHHPIKAKEGQTFRKFVSQLTELGYDVQHRELVAADYGAPTIRKRFFLIARCDGKPIVWPEPTHAPKGSIEVETGMKLPWRSAAEVIDWSVPCPSIFASKEEIKAQYKVNAVRPLRPNTLRRIARGIEKFVLKDENPFFVNIGRKKAPCLIQYHSEQTERVRGQSVSEPLMTVDAANRYGLAVASLVEYFSTGRPLDVREPMHTATSHDREALVAAHIAEFKGQDKGQDARRPLRTITASIGEFGVVKTTCVNVENGVDLQRWCEVRNLLNTYCNYSIKEDELLLLEVNGVNYYICDIGLRMLTPRELYKANGFPDDYIIDKDYYGNAYGKSKQVARCGNAVPPPFATALVRANLPEWCDREYETMNDFHNASAS